MVIRWKIVIYFCIGMPALTADRVGILIKHFHFLVYNDKCEKNANFSINLRRQEEITGHPKPKIKNPRVGNGIAVIGLWYVIDSSNVIHVQSLKNYWMVIFWTNFTVVMVNMSTNVMATMTKSYSFQTLSSKLCIWICQLMIYYLEKTYGIPMSNLGLNEPEIALMTQIT